VGGNARGFWAVAACMLVLSLAVAACGSSPAAKSPTPASTSEASSVGATCQQVAAVLSDGPDPDADPVGYALAQIKPLRAIHTSDTSLGAAIDALSSAYQKFYDDNGTKAASSLVTSADSRVDKFCPGATS
jgi:hypothetical protein